MLAGVAGGIALGEMAADTRAGSSSGEPATYSHLSANPDALMPQGDRAAPCLDCADSYGIAVRLRAHRGDGMGDEFREPGTVDVDAPSKADPDDDYRYGGRFPDPPPALVADENSAPGTTADAPAPAETPAQAGTES